MRDKWKENLANNLKFFWGGGDVDPGELHVSKAMANMVAFKGAIRSLDAKTPEQKDAVAGAMAHLGQIEQTRLLMSLQLANPFSKPLLVVVVFWSFFLFCGFGLLSRLNATTIGALVFDLIQLFDVKMLPHPAGEARRRGSSMKDPVKAQRRESRADVDRQLDEALEELFPRQRPVADGAHDGRRPRTSVEGDARATARGAARVTPSRPAKPRRSEQG